jgi:hypothetical protein
LGIAIAIAVLSVVVGILLRRTETEILDERSMESVIAVRLVRKST